MSQRCMKSCRCYRCMPLQSRDTAVIRVTLRSFSKLIVTDNGLHSPHEVPETLVPGKQPVHAQRKHQLLQ